MDWEMFVANYEIFCNNLFVELKKYKGVSLREFYHEAVGKDSVLNIKTRLEKLYHKFSIYYNYYFYITTI
jgi:hypothetical protein